MNSSAKVAFAILGGIKPSLTHFSPQMEQSIRTALEKAVQLGHEMLMQGVSSVDTVTRVIAFLEDTPCFNAGKGSVLIRNEMVEMDAAIMDGKNGHYAGVAGVKHIKNPVQLAQKIMAEKSGTIMYADGAEAFAFLHDIEYTEQDYFFTDERYDELLAVKSDHNAVLTGLSGAVSAIAMDCEKSFAAATSTGGNVNRQPGLISESAVAGKTILAENDFGALAVSSDEKSTIPFTLSFRIAEILKSLHASAEQSKQVEIESCLSGISGDVGLIAIDQQGNILSAANGAGSFRASIDVHGSMSIKMNDVE